MQECLELRIKDTDLSRCEIIIRRAKGAKDRVTVIPQSCNKNRGANRALITLL